MNASSILRQSGQRSSYDGITGRRGRAFCTVHTAFSVLALGGLLDLGGNVVTVRGAVLFAKVIFPMQPVMQMRRIEDEYKYEMGARNLSCHLYKISDLATPIQAVAVQI